MPSRRLLQPGVPVAEVGGGVAEVMEAMPHPMVAESQLAPRIEH